VTSRSFSSVYLRSHCQVTLVLCPGEEKPLLSTQYTGRFLAHICTWLVF